MLTYTIHLHGFKPTHTHGRLRGFVRDNYKGSPILLNNLDYNQIVKVLREQVHALAEKIKLDNNDKIIIS